MEDNGTTAAAPEDPAALGQGGTLVIVNATREDWYLTHTDHHQMHGWDFPPVVHAGSMETVYIEWDENILHDKHKDTGEARYRIGQAGGDFEFQALWPKGHDRRIQVKLRSVETTGHNAGAVISLGWNHNGAMNWIISGEPGRYESTDMPLGYAWMDAHLDRIGERTLREIALPGSHDSGMSTLGHKTAFATRCNTVTQSQNVFGQLQRGVRYFDIRPVISSGKYFTGHYSHINSTLGWQGGNGESIADVVKDVNNFTAGRPELVVLRLSHDVDTDSGEPNYHAFTQKQYDGLLDVLVSGLTHLHADPAVADLTKVPLNRFIGRGPDGKPKAAVLIVADPSDAHVTVAPRFRAAGVYPASAFPVVDQYTGTESVKQMAADQVHKMLQNRTSPDATVFVLSWTLTQSGATAATCELPTSKSIIELADEANPEIYRDLWRSLTSRVYPNVLYTDNVNQTWNAELAMGINFLAVPRAAEAGAEPVAVAAEA